MIETERLKIIPLDYGALLDYILTENIFENKQGFKETGRIISDDLKEMIESFTLPKMKESTADNYLFYTIWIVVDKAENSIVAELGFRGEPNGLSEIEIGYGTMPGQWGKGFMTEAVSGMLQWCKKQPAIKYVLANTDQNNIASIRIVQKNGFSGEGIKDDLLAWRIAV